MTPEMTSLGPRDPSETMVSKYRKGLALSADHGPFEPTRILSISESQNRSRHSVDGVEIA